MLVLAYCIIGYWEREQAKQRKVHKKMEMKSSHKSLGIVKLCGI